MDDDHTFPSGHFAHALQPQPTKDPQAVWTTGEIGFMDGKSHGNLEIAVQLHPSGVGGPVSDPDNNWAISDGSTLIYPRTVFERGLRMVEDMGYGSSYLEFGAFLYRHGFRSRCIPGAMVQHYATASDCWRPWSLKSRLFASLCFHPYFQPNRMLAAKYLLLYAFLRQPALLFEFPYMIKKARTRWNFQG